MYSPGCFRMMLSEPSFWRAWFNFPATNTSSSVLSPIAHTNLLRNSSSCNRIFSRYFSFTYPVPRRLREVVKMSLFEKEDVLMIRQLWIEKYKSNPLVVSDVMYASEYKQFKQNGDHCPMFIYPIVKPAGFFNLVLQIQDKQILFTPLQAFQQDAATAPLFFSITFFDELLSGKGIVLIRGDIISTELSCEDAERLLVYTRRFYTNANDFKWVEKFNKKPREFDFNGFMTMQKKLFIR